jgi:hypothetical protein
MATIVYRDPRITCRLGLDFEIPATFINLRCSATSSRLYIFATEMDLHRGGNMGSSSLMHVPASRL